MTYDTILLGILVFLVSFFWIEVAFLEKCLSCRTQGQLKRSLRQVFPHQAQCIAVDGLGPLGPDRMAGSGIGLATYT